MISGSSLAPAHLAGKASDTRIGDTVNSLHLGLFDEKNLLELTPIESSNERLIACK